MPGLNSPTLRSLSADDADLLADISAEAFAQPFDPPWSVDDFRTRLRPAEALPLSAPCFAGWLAEVEGSQAGFVFLQLFDASVEILKLATRPQFRRRGVARKLIQTVVEAWPDWEVDLEVAATNAAACALYSQMGFRQIAVRRRYYAVSGHPELAADALVLRHYPA